MNSPDYYTPEEAEQRLRERGNRAPTAELIRLQAKTRPELLGFPAAVIGTNVYIPRKSFDAFWGIENKKAAAG